MIVVIDVCRHRYNLHTILRRGCYEGLPNLRLHLEDMTLVRAEIKNSSINQIRKYGAFIFVGI